MVGRREGGPSGEPTLARAATKEGCLALKSAGLAPVTNSRTLIPSSFGPTGAGAGAFARDAAGAPSATCYPVTDQSLALRDATPLAKRVCKTESKGEYRDASTHVAVSVAPCVMHVSNAYHCFSPLFLSSRRLHHRQKLKHFSSNPAPQVTPRPKP